MEIGKELKRLREDCGYTQTIVAEYLGIDQTFLSKIENGEREPSVGLIEDLAMCYRCDSDQLLKGEANVIQIPFRKDAITPEDVAQLAEANKIILNLREMVSFKEKYGHWNY